LFEDLTVTVTPSGERNALAKAGAGMKSWVDLDRASVTRRYDRLARLIPLFDWIFFQPPGFRRNAVDWLQLRPGDRVLEIGCGTGRNLPYLRKAVGPAGRVFGVDISHGMLAKARELCSRHEWDNVVLTEQDAADYSAPEPLDGVMFGLSYNTMPHHLTVLRHCWNQLRPGGRLVIMDARLPPRLAGTFLVPISLWLMKRTLVSNPLIRPWEDVARLADDFAMQQYMLGSWYICRAVKPTSTSANGRPAVDSLPLPA
jgi:demethylmenaquinone methyltransferase/2-methoxy-6-polyprenyl-1,4-benzoquinol methylase